MKLIIKHIMKLTILLILLSCCVTGTAQAQFDQKAFKAFLESGERLIDVSGDGVKQAPGDILLETISDEGGDFETLIILRNENGKLRRVAENSELLISKDALGIAGGAFPSLVGNILSVDYTIGSGSGSSRVSMEFEKVLDGEYYFKQYSSTSSNYGVENLFARQCFTAAQTGKVAFTAATEGGLLEKGTATATDNTAPVGDAQKRFARYIPEGFQLAAFAEGDVNLDGLKEDLVLILYDDNSCSVRLLLAKDGGGFELAETNSDLVTVDNTFNAHNLKAVVKNGFFTVEQRVVTSESDFDHRYVTFKFDPQLRSWLLHRLDVEHYQGFSIRPEGNGTHLTKADFGEMTFKSMKTLPGIYYFEPAVSVVGGTLSKKMVYGPPNYGETPEKDERGWIYVLKTDFPIEVLAEPDASDRETADKTITEISKVRVYSSDSKVNFNDLLGKHIKLRGVFQFGRSGSQQAKVLMDVQRILN